jgi:hypothetical protein
MAEELGGVNWLTGSSLPAFDKVSLSGMVDAVVGIDLQADRSISWPEGAAQCGLNVRFLDDGWLRIEVDTQPEERPAVEIKAKTLQTIRAVGDATVMVAGAAEEVKFVAFRGAHIDASDLRLMSAEVDLETGAMVELCAFNSVTGGVAYHARLVLLGEPAHTRIATGNGGRIQSLSG